MIRHVTFGYLISMTSTCKHSSVAVWNSLPADIRNCSSLSSFRIDLRLKIHLLCASVWTGPADPAAAVGEPIICDKQVFTLTSYQLPWTWNEAGSSSWVTYFW